MYTSRLEKSKAKKKKIINSLEEGMKHNSCEHEDQFVKTVAVIDEECMNIV